MERYRVRVAGNDVLFSSAHFITWSETECERLHGHDYRVRADISGPLGPDRYVYDFLALKALLRRILEPIDHRVLLPGRSPRLRVEERGDSLRVSFGAKEWILPRGDCAVLPVENVTAEEMAAWIAGRLREEMARQGLHPPERIIIEVEEGPGQTAICELDGAS